METPQAQRRPKPLDAQAGTQPQYQQPVGLLAAPYVRRFGEDINESAPQQTEQLEARQPDARHLAPELAASYRITCHNTVVVRRCQVPAANNPMMELSIIWACSQPQTPLSILLKWPDLRLPSAGHGTCKTHSQT